MEKEFEALWKQENPQEEDEEEAPPDEYQRRDGIAWYKIMCDILGFYYHARYGTPLPLAFDAKANNDKVVFRLKEENQ